MKKLVIVLCLVLLFFLGCSKDEPLPQPSPKPQVNDQNRPIQNGTLPEEPQLPGALAVMIDNYYKARPQSGLNKADMVYEMMAEAGITRFMALFYRQEAEKIGPVRSARYYFVQLARGYDVPLAHAGGSEDALQMVVDLKVKDLDEIYNSGNCFWRDSGKKMPHNLYTSTELLAKGAKAKGYGLVPLPTLPTATEWEGDTLPQDKDIVLDYSSGEYRYLVSWHYNGQSYERRINGQPHAMEDGAVITADNVIVMKAQTATKVKNKIPLSEIKITGKGEVRYYIGGKMMKGTWSKNSPQAVINFYDSTGKPMKFKEGKTWVQVIPD